MPITQVALHPNQAEITTADVEGRIRVWDIGMKYCSNELYVCTCNDHPPHSCHVEVHLRDECNEIGEYFTIRKHDHSCQ